MKMIQSLGVAGVVSVAVLAVATAPAFAQQGDEDSLTIMLSSNDGLRAQGMDYIVQQIDYFRQDGGKASARLYQNDFAWVPGDGRRGASDGSLSVLFDAANGTSGGYAAAAVSNAVGRAVRTWSADSCLVDTPLMAEELSGADVTVFDGLAGTGTIGDPFAADVVVAGFPETLGDLFSSDTIAFSVTFIFVDGSGTPTDVDGDGRLDTAHNEIYFNPDFDWTLDETQPGADIETTALHELGHALGLGHFGAPPASVMNPVYNGVQRSLYQIDHAALCILY